MRNLKALKIESQLLYCLLKLQREESQNNIKQPQLQGALSLQQKGPLKRVHGN